MFLPADLKQTQRMANKGGIASFYKLWKDLRLLEITEADTLSAAD